MSATDSRYEDSAYDDDSGSTRTEPGSEGRDAVLSDGPVLLPVDPDPEKTDDDAPSPLPDRDPVTADSDDSETRVGGEVNDLDDDKFGDTITHRPTEGSGFATDSTGVTTSTDDSSVLTPDGDDVITDADADKKTDFDTKTDVDASTGSDSITGPDGTKDPDFTTGTDVPTGTDAAADGAAPTVGPDTETGALKDPVAVGSLADSPAVPVPASDTRTPGTSSSSDVSSDWLELQGKFVDDPAAAVKEAGAKVEQALAELRSRSESGSTEDLRTAFRRYRELHAGLT